MKQERRSPGHCPSGGRTSDFRDLFMSFKSNWTLPRQPPPAIAGQETTMGMGNYFTSLLDVVIVIGALGLCLSVVIPRGPGNTICGRRWVWRKEKGRGGGEGSDLGYEDMIKYAIKRAQDKSRRDCDSRQTFPAWCALPAHVGAVRRRNYESAINSFSCRRADRGGVARLPRWFHRVQSLNF